MPWTDIVTQVHSNTLTEQRSKFINEYGRLASHILFCEFIDNALKALLQSAVLKLPLQVNLPPIEVHLIFSKEHPYLLKHICFFDAGPGMSLEAMIGWSKFAAPAAQRESENQGAAELRQENDAHKPPFQAGGELGCFGKGSKAAGFFYGESVTAVTKTAGRAEPTRELRLDANKMEAAGEEWQRNGIYSRRQGRDAILADESPWHKHFCDDKDKALLALLERADQHPTYSLFIVSQINERVAEELPAEAVQAVASELRDVYFVYCDGLACALQRMRERAAEGTAGAPIRSATFPPAQFKFSPLDVHIVTWQAEQLDCPIQRISLRDDPKLPAATSLGVAPPGAKATSVSRLVETAREEQASLKAREVLSQMHAQLLAAQRWSPIELMALAAPDPFFFKFDHPSWSTVWGMALYLPFTGGRESKDELQLHDKSRAVCFWAGRLMPYCKLPSLLPWMDWAKKDKSCLEVAERVVMLLFFGQVKNVDDTKFRLADDILNDLSKPNAAPTGWEAWREGQHGRVAWAQTSGRRVEEEFKKWNVEANTKYDEHCELSERMPDTVVRDGKEYALFGRLQYGSRSSLTAYESGDVAKLKLTLHPSHTGGVKPRVVLGRIRHFLVELATVPAGKTSHNCASCEVVVTREPESLYSSKPEHVVKAQALVSKDRAMVSALEKEEFKKAPSQLQAGFLQKDAVADGASDSAPAFNERLGRRSGEPLLVEANQPLPVVRVRPLNAAGALIYDWRHSNSLEPLQVEQAVSYAEGSGASAGASALGGSIGARDFGEAPPAGDGQGYESVVNESVWKPEGKDDSEKGYYFNGDKSSLSFWKAGMYKLSYRLKALGGGMDLAAELFVLVAPALVVRLWCDLAPPHDGRPVRLSERLETPVKKLGGGYGIEIRVRLRDGEGDYANTRLVSDGHFREMAETPEGDSGEGIVVYPWELESRSGLTTGVGRLQVLDGKKTPKGFHGGCRLFVGHKEDDVDLPLPPHLGEGQFTAGLWPSEAAVQRQIFSRHSPHTVTMKIALNHVSGVTRSKPEGTVDVPIVSAAPLRLRLARTAAPPNTSLPSATDGPKWLHASAAEALAAAAPLLSNRAPLPAKLAVALRDDFECSLPLGVVVRISAACVSPDALDAATTAPCPGVDGMSAVLNASGVAVFKRMTPKLSSFSTVAEAHAPEGGVVRGALVRFRFTAAVGTDDSEAVPATPVDAAALATEAEELAQLQVDRFLFLSASRVPAALRLSRGGQPLRADGAGALVLNGCAGGTVGDVVVAILNEVGDCLSWDEADRAGILTLDGKKADGRIPLAGLKLPSSIDDKARYRLAFTPKPESSIGAITLEAHLVLKPEPGQPAKWLVRRSAAAPAAAAAGRRGALGPLELRVGQSLPENFTIALVDDKGNACRRAALARGVAPILSVRSGSEAAGPWLVLGGRAGSDVNGTGRLAQSRELLLDHEAVEPEGDAIWQVSTRADTHVSLFGPASSNDRPKEMLSVSDAHGAFEEGLLPLKLLAGPPYSLELETKSKTALCSRDLCTRERLASLVFVVTDAASNPVPVDSLTIKPLAAAAPALLRVTHARAMEPEGNSGARWSLRDVHLIANRDAHAESSSGSAVALRRTHELAFGGPPVAKAADGSAYYLQCAAMPLATCIRDEFVVDFMCGSDNPEEAVAGIALHPLKLELRMENGSSCNWSEMQLRNASSLRNQQAHQDNLPAYATAMPSLDCVECVLNAPDGKVVLSRIGKTALFGLPAPAPAPDAAGAVSMDASGDASMDASMDASRDASGDASADVPSRLTRAGSYSVMATYREHRPKVLEALEGTQEKVVTKTVYWLNLRAGPPTRLRWARAPPELACNNTKERQVFGQLEAQLEDEFGNPAVAGGALSGATLTAVLASEAETPASSAAAAAPPRLEGSVSGILGENSSRLIIGPVAIEHGTGRGNSQLAITFRLRAAGGAAALARVELPPDLAVSFTDTFAMAEEEARAKEGQAAEDRRLKERQAELHEARLAKEGELQAVNVKRRRMVEEIRNWSSDLVSQAEQVLRLNVQLSDWVATWSELRNLSTESRVQLQRHFQSPPPHGDPAPLAQLTADVLQVEPQPSDPRSTLWRELAALISGLRDFAKPGSSDESFLSARQHLLALPSPAGSLGRITEAAVGLEAMCAQLYGRHAVNMVDGLSDRERDLVKEFRSLSEQNRQECFGFIADLLVVPYVGPATRSVAAVVSAVASPRLLQSILLQSEDAADRLRKYARDGDVRLGYQVLQWADAGQMPQPQRVAGVVFSPAIGQMVQPNPVLSREDQAKVRVLIPLLFRNTVLVHDETDAKSYRRGIRGKAPRIVALDGTSISNGGFSDRADGQLPTEGELGRAAHFAISTRPCPLTDLAFQVRHFANSLETRSRDVQEKIPQWDQETCVSQRLEEERTHLVQQMDDVLQRLNAHGAAMKQNKRPRAEGSSAGARPVCPRVDTPSSSQGQGTQFMNGRRAETRLHSDPSPGYGQRGNGQQHNGA